jgi:hypothetical protein
VNRSAFIRFAVAGAFCLFTAPSSRAGVARYSVTNLNEAYGFHSVYSLNEVGGVTGVVVLGEDHNDYTIRTSGLAGTIDHGKIGDLGLFGFTGANASGQGLALVAANDVGDYFMAELDGSGRFRDLGYDAAGNSPTLGKQNSSGVAVGYEWIDSNPKPNGTSIYGFIYQPGVGVTNVGYLGGAEVYRFNAINDLGWIVGSGITGEGRGALMMWIPGEEAITLIESNTTVGTPHDVNNVGAVIGEFGFRAFHWYDGVVTPVGRRYVEDPSRPGRINDASGVSVGLDINNSGIAVGWSMLRSVPGFVAAHQQGGWLWSEANGTEWLDDLVDPALGLHFGSAIAINDSGQILARTLINGEVIHYLLNPIPEPRCAGHLLTALALVVLRRRR